MYNTWIYIYLFKRETMKNDTLLDTVCDVKAGIWCAHLYTPCACLYFSWYNDYFRPTFSVPSVAAPRYVCFFFSQDVSNIVVSNVTKYG